MIAALAITSRRRRVHKAKPSTAYAGKYRYRVKALNIVSKCVPSCQAKCSTARRASAMVVDQPANAAMRCGHVVRLAGAGLELSGGELPSGDVSSADRPSLESGRL